MRISASKISSILQCPYRFNHGDYIESEYMQAGTNMHAELEKILRTDINAGRKYLQGKYPFISFLKNIVEHGIEDKIEVKIPNKDDVLVGVIDYWEKNNDTVHIIDWKTGFVISDSDIQPLMYAFLLNRKGVWLTGNAIIHIAYLNRNIVKTFVYESVEDVLSRLNNKIELALKYLQSDVRIPNKYCQYCQFRFNCIVAPNENDYPEDLVEAINKLKMVERYANQLKEHIKHRAEVSKERDELPDDVKIKIKKKECVSSTKNAVKFLLDAGVKKELLPATVDMAWLRKHKEYYNMLFDNGLITQSSSTEVSLG